MLRWTLTSEITAYQNIFVMAKNTEEEKTDQLLLRPPKPLIKKIRDAAKQYGFKSGSQAAVNLIEEFFNEWVELQEQFLRVREERHLRATGKVPAALPQKERRKAS